MTLKLTRPWFYYFTNLVFRTIFPVIFRLDIRGREDVPREGGLIIAISHSSFIDPLVTGTYIPRDVIPMTKVEAFDYPILGALIRFYGAFGVRRGQVDMTAIKTALKILQNCNALIIAPEGHRSEEGGLQRGREGAIILSLRSGMPILPVAVWGGKPLWKNLASFRRTDVHLHFGKPVLPITTEGKPTRERIAGMSDELMVRIAKLMPVELRGYYRDRMDIKGYLRNYDSPVSNPARKQEVTHVE
jgi:1-acyl-sn-glycerol-3-phosphate acyltransferase